MAPQNVFPLRNVVVLQDPPNHQNASLKAVCSYIVNALSVVCLRSFWITEAIDDAFRVEASGQRYINKWSLAERAWFKIQHTVVEYKYILLPCWERQAKNPDCDCFRSALNQKYHDIIIIGADPSMHVLLWTCWTLHSFKNNDRRSG